VASAPSPTGPSTRNPAPWSRSDPERVERVLADLTTLLDERERLFRRHRLDSPAALRRARAEGRLPESVYGDVFLLIDGLAAAREAMEDLDDKLSGLVTRGPALGLHTVVTAATSSQVRSRMQAAFGGRVELRLSDPFDSTLGRKAAETLPRDVPGRMLLTGERIAQVALPRIDGGTGLDDLADAERDLTAEVIARWSGRSPGAAVASVRVLPDRVDLDDLPAATELTSPVLGIGDRDLGPVTLDMAADPHLIVYGDSRTGKSALLRTLLRQFASVPYERVGIVVVDPRRSHLGLIGTEHQLAYCTERNHTAAVLTEVAAQIRKRLPGPEVTPRQLRERSWWKGLEMFVVADDLDLVTAGGTNPLSPLLEFIPQGADLGLHLIVARRTGGAARAIYEPVLQSLTEMSSPGMLFSGDRMEGRLVNGIASRRLPEGRALLARRGMPAEQIQVAWTPPVTD
jgi:S-DNA-T family DNA segregation ATPase FtsK/SpoIIIE